MVIRKNLIVAGTLATIGISALGVGAVSAAQNPGHDDLVTKIASKFNLNKDEVQTVFDENKVEHQQERQDMMEERLTKAVENNKITEDQKSKIIAKMEENKTFFKSLKDMSKEDRKSALEQHKEEMKAWAEENGIDQRWVGPPRGHMHHGLEHGEHGLEQEPGDHSEYTEQ